MQKKSLKYSSILLLIIGLNISFNYIFLAKNPTYVDVCDQIHHLNNKTKISHQLENIIKNHEPFVNRIKKSIGLLNTKSDWPNLVYFITAVINHIFGQSTVVSDMSNSLYLIILLVAVYLIGKECFGGPEAGLLAAFVLSCFPIVRSYSVAYGLDFPLAAMLTLSMFLLWRADNFRNGAYAVLFGIIFGLGILVKSQIIIFLIGPLGYVFYKIINQKDRSSLGNLVLALIIGLVLSSVWWQGNLKEVINNHLRTTDFGYKIRDYNKVFSAPWLFFYVTRTVQGITVPVAIFFIFAFRPFLRSKIVKAKPIWLLWFFGSYLILTIISIKWDRYFLPALPVIALIISSEAMIIENRRYRIMAIILLISFSCLGCWEISQKRERNNYEIMTNNLMVPIQRAAKSESIKIAIIEDGDFNKNTEAGILKYLLAVYMPAAQVYLSDEEWGSFSRNYNQFDFLLIGYSPLSDLIRMDIFKTLTNNGLKSEKTDFYIFNIDREDSLALAKQALNADKGRIKHALPMILISRLDKKGPEKILDNLPIEKVFYHNQEELIELLAVSGRWIYLKEAIYWPGMVHVLLFQQLIENAKE